MTATSIQFINAGSDLINVHWLNYNGQRELYQTLPAKTQYVQPTYVTHPWLVSDVAGRCFAIYLPVRQPSKAILFSATNPTPVAKAAVRATLEITSIGEEFKFDTTKLSAKVGTQVALIFKNNAKTPGLQHNWVLVKAGTKDEVSTAGTAVGPTNDWVPRNDARVLANTKLVDPGKTGEVEFTAPTAGTYQFVCTFPSHSFTMFGEFVVTQ